MKVRHKNFNLILGISLVCVIMIPVFIGLFYTPYEASTMNAAAKSMPPSLKHWFGTDYFGRDIFSRVQKGAQMTFLVGFLTVLIGGSIGVFVGAVTGYFGGVVDDILMRINDGLAAFPSVLLALIMVSIFGTSKYMVVITLGIVFIPSFARVARSEFIVQKSKDYVLNAKLMGAGSIRIMLVHILPNTKAILLSAIAIGFNNAVLAEAGLSYLSIGAQPTDMSLGRMLADAQSYLLNAPWFALAPGLVIVFTVLGFSLIGEEVGKGKQDNTSDDSTGVVRKAENKQEILESKPSTEKGTLLRINHLAVGFCGAKCENVVDDISFQVNKGEILGIVGESGSGKSMTALAIMGLLKKDGFVTGGSIQFNGKSLETLSEEEYRKLRGNEMSMVFQEPMTSLNPVMTVGYQVEELLMIHGAIEVHAERKKKAIEALREAGLKNPEEIYPKYPHQLSGGMRQRVMIAMAMICNPKLLIADEPTTALDVTIQAKILKVLKNMNEKYGTAIIFISHDLNVIKKMCSRVVVMHQGKIVEQGDIESIFKHPQHEYTRVLLKASSGSAVDDIRETVHQDSIDTTDENALTDNIIYSNTSDTITADKKIMNHAKNKVSAIKHHHHILDIKNLNVFYEEKSKRFLHKQIKKQVVKEVTLHINQGEILGVVGESGCGKSSLAKAIVGLQRLTDGMITVDAAQPQMVFQDPYGSLNPTKKIGWLLEEPLKLNSNITKEVRLLKVDEILLKVGLPKQFKNRYPENLSGGQRQRVAIAMALILSQKLIILDEPVSALDVTVQEQILDLLLKLREEENLSYLFISHDMYVIRRMCDYVCVMYQGEIVEHARTEELFTNPKHTYTKKLLDAVLR